MEDIYSSDPKRSRSKDDTQELDPNAYREMRDIYSGRNTDDYTDIDTYQDIYSGAKAGDTDDYPYDDYDPQTPRSPHVLGEVPPLTRYADEEPEDIYSGKRPPRQGRAGVTPAPKKKKKRRGCCACGSIFLALTAILLAFLIAGGMYLYHLVGKIDFNEDGAVSNPYIEESTLAQDGRVTNILFIGVDARGEESKSRSDTMLMLSIDGNNKRLKLTSFLRDTWVDYPDGTEGRLNGASFEKGPQYTIDMIEYTYRVRCDYYAMVDFEMFREIVDKLGGIDVELTEKEAAYMGSGKAYAPHPPIQVSPGVSHLDGNAALWYSRIRYLDDDYHRTERQRKVVSAIIAKAKTLKPAQLIDLAKAILPDVETNMGQGQIIKFGINALGCMKASVLQQQIPAKDTFKNRTIRGNAVLVPDLDANRQILKDFLYGTDPAEDSTAQ